MATARDRADQTPGETLFVTPVDIRDYLPIPYSIREPSVDTPDPEFVVVREIDMATPGSLYPFIFQQPDDRRPYSEFEAIIKSLREGTYKRCAPVNQYYRPLDVKLAARTCFVFYLSDRWNWRFSSKVRAASMGVADPEIQWRYTKLRHYVDDEIGSPDPFPHDKYCRILSFNAIPVDDPVKPGTEFNHKFNLVVEFVYPDGDAPHKENTIPIIIDPDVRYPGGSGNG